MKIDKKFIEQFTGSLSKEKLEGDSKKMLSIFSAINTNKDDKIDVEEIANFANSVLQNNYGVGEVNDSTIFLFLRDKHRELLNNGIKPSDIKNFFNFFLKKSDKSQTNEKVITNEDGTYYITSKYEEFEENTKEPVSKGFVDKKVNYNAKGEITTIEEIRGNVTTITDSKNRPLKVIIKNDNAKDTIKEYTYNNDGAQEEAIFYGENGVKDSKTPAYKNFYSNGELNRRIEYDSSGKIKQEYEYNNQTIVGVNKYENGKKVNNVKLFTQSNDYTVPDETFDEIIDPSKQNYTGDCWLLNGLSMLSKTTWGRELIDHSIYTRGDTTSVKIYSKRYTISMNELEQAKNARRSYYKLEMSKGDIVYIDGKKELASSKDCSSYFGAETVNSNITIVSQNGKKQVLTKENLENNTDCKVEGPKYSSGDLTTLAFELAIEKYRKESGVSLDGGTTVDLVSMLDASSYRNNNVKYNIINNNEITHTMPKSDATYNNSESKLQNLYNEREFNNQYSRGIRHEYSNASSDQLIKILKKVKDNPDKYAVGLSLIMDGGLHAAHLLRLEECDGKDYIVYTHSWNNKAEVREPLENFVKNSLSSMSLFEGKNNQPINVNSDSKIGTFKMGTKSNRTNFVSVIAALSQDPNFKPNITKDENNNYIVKIKDKNIRIAPNELETAKLSGFYSSYDDDVSILELAVERYINNTKHNNTMYELAHTNLEDAKFEDIMGLFSNKKIAAKTTSLQEASKMNNTQFVCQKTANGDRYLAVKEIKCMPDGTYKISVIQPEDTSIVVTYLEHEFKGEIITFE